MSKYMTQNEAWAYMAAYYKDVIEKTKDWKESSRLCRLCTLTTRLRIDGKIKKDLEDAMDDKTYHRINTVCDFLDCTIPSPDPAQERLEFCLSQIKGPMSF